MVSPASTGPSRRTVLKSSAAGAVATTGWCSPSSAQGVAKAIFVLVHPAWLGGWCWRKVTPLLRDRGHDVYTPTLTGLGERLTWPIPKSVWGTVRVGWLLQGLRIACPRVWHRWFTWMLLCGRPESRRPVAA